MKPNQKRVARALAKTDPLKAELAVAHALRTARDLLRFAGAANAADYVARALKSAEGARNHATRRWRESKKDPGCEARASG